MLKEIHLVTKNHKFILLILTILLVFGILVVFVFDVNCLFKSVFSIPCPGCGLTRGFRCLFKGDIIGAFEYNILVIPIFLFLVILVFIFIFDIVKKKNYLEKYLLFFRKYYVVLIVLVIISFIVNIIRGI